MVLGTYVNLYEADTKSAAKVSELNVLPPQNLDRIPDLVKDELVVNVAAPEVEGKPALEKEKEIVEPGDWLVLAGNGAILNFWRLIRRLGANSN